MYPCGISTFCFTNFNLITFKGDNPVIAYITRLESFSCVVFNENQISFLKFSRNWVNIVCYFWCVQFSSLCYHFINILSACIDKIFSSLPKYHTCGCSSLLRGRIASLPNIRKNRLSFECSFGKKLYAAQASGTTSSHSTCDIMCFEIQDLRK